MTYTISARKQHYLTAITAALLCFVITFEQWSLLVETRVMLDTSIRHSEAWFAPLQLETPISSDESIEHHGKTCASIVASDFEKATGGKYSATYFLGGYKKIGKRGKAVKRWKWPEIFSLALEKNGWRHIKEATACTKATFKILRDAGGLDSTIYDRYCSRDVAHDNNNSQMNNDDKNESSGNMNWMPTFTLGLKGDEYLQNKESFQNLVRGYEISKNATSSVSNSYVPLTFMLNQDSECKTFFASDWVPQRAWVSKKKSGYGGAGVDIVNDFEAFRKKYGNCHNRGKAPMAQELIKPPLANGKSWNYRVYLMIVNLEPLVVFRRLGDLKICSEDYEKRNDPDPIVRAGATKCNLRVAVQGRHWESGKADQTNLSDVLKSFDHLGTFLAEDMVQRVFEQTDESLRTLVKAMLPDVLNPTNVDHPDHHMGFYAIDAMYDELQQQVKLLDFNTAMTEIFIKYQIGTDEIHGLPYAEDFARVALTSFQQFHLSDDRYSVDACADRFTLWNRIL